MNLVGLIEYLAIEHEDGISKQAQIDFVISASPYLCRHLAPKHGGNRIPVRRPIGYGSFPLTSNHHCLLTKSSKHIIRNIDSLSPVNGEERESGMIVMRSGGYIQYHTKRYHLLVWYLKWSCAEGRLGGLAN